LEEQDQNRFQSSFLFFLALCFSLSRTYRKRGWRLLNLPRVISNQKKKTRELQHRSVAATRTTVPQRRNRNSSQRRSVATTRAVAPQRRNHASCSTAASQPREL
jgi:hypothetical protein